MGLLSGYARFPIGTHAKGQQRNRWTLGLTLSGKVLYSGTSKEAILGEGSFVIIRPDTHSAWRVPSPCAEGKDLSWETIWFVFVPPPHFIQWLQYPVPSDGYIQLKIEQPKALQDIREIFFKAHTLAISTHPGRESLSLNALEEALILCHFKNGAAAKNNFDPRIEKAMQYLSQNIHRPVGIDEVGRVCCLSRPRIQVLFRQQVGSPIAGWFEQQKMVQASKRLRSGMLSIKQVASELGYRDPKYFSKRFSSLMGHLPSTLVQQK